MAWAVAAPGVAGAAVVPVVTVRVRPQAAPASSSAGSERLAELRKAISSSLSLDHFAVGGSALVDDGGGDCSSKGSELDRRTRPLRTPRKRLPSWLKTDIPTGGR